MARTGARFELLLAPARGWVVQRASRARAGGDHALVPELVGRPLAELVPPRQRPQFVAHLREGEADLPSVLDLDLGQGVRRYQVRTVSEVGPARRVTLSDVSSAPRPRGPADAGGADEEQQEDGSSPWHVDPLTGLPDRRVLRDRLAQALRRAGRNGSSVGVLFIDVDGFKAVNDGQGHLVGDALLRLVAQRLASVLRPADTLARVGGDEFAVVLEDLAGEAAAGEEAARELASRLVALGREPALVGGQPQLVTTSVGVTVTADAGRGVDALLEEADAAMYEAKRRGRDRYAVFDERLRLAGASRVSLRRRLTQALQDGQLTLEFQPVARLRDGAHIGDEALLRVGAGPLPLHPAEFLEVARASGLLRALDSWVLRTAVRHACAPGGSDRAATWLCVNIGAADLVPEFPDELLALLSEHGLPPSWLQLDLPESDLFDCSRRALDVLAEVRAQGVRVGLDGVGGSASRPARLPEYEVDVVKLDAGVVTDVVRDRVDRAIARAVVGIGHACGFAVGAAGVATPAQWAVLRELGYDEAQGVVLSVGTVVDLTGATSGAGTAATVRSGSGPSGRRSAPALVTGAWEGQSRPGVR